MPRSSKIGLGELRVGLLVLIAIAVLIVLILNASGNLNPFARHLHLRARFGDANGLREGSEVRLAGVRIGQVDRIRLMTASEVGPGPNPPKIEVFQHYDRWGARNRSHPQRLNGATDFAEPLGQRDDRQHHSRLGSGSARSRKRHLEFHAR